MTADRHTVAATDAASVVVARAADRGPGSVRAVRRLRSGELERLVLDVVWDAERPLTPGEVHEALLPQRKMAYTTVMTILVRLWQKGLLIREQHGRAFAYRAAVTREERAASRMQEFLAAAGDRSLALMRFVDGLSAEEVAQLRRAVRRRST